MIKSYCDYDSIFLKEDKVCHMHITKKVLVHVDASMINTAVRETNACAIWSYSNLDSLKVDGIHHSTLKKLDGGVVTL